MEEDKVVPFSAMSNFPYPPRARGLLLLQPELATRKEEKCKSRRGRQMKKQVAKVP